MRLKLVFVVVFGLQFVLAQSMPARADLRIETGIEYANVDGQSLKLDLYHAATADPAPVVVWIHGGAWIQGNRAPCPIAYLTDHGYTVASISYRFTDKAIFPAQIHDCKAAVRWLRALYPNSKIAVAGASAGGMLAALLGTSGDVKELEGTVGEHLDQSSRVDAVIDYFGATDFVLRSKTQPKRANEPGSVVYKLFGGGANEKVELAQLASAAYHVSPDDPPMLVFHGDQDKVVLIDQSQRIDEVYKKAQLPIELVVLPGVGHGGKEFFGDTNKKKIFSFLFKTLNQAN